HWGPPRGEGGPWKDTSVEAGKPSDPYLMAGYDKKELTLSHQSQQAVRFRIEVDVLGLGEWVTYAELAVEPGQTRSFEFDDDYSAHWVRLVPNKSTTATAWFRYQAN
ncbi:MAG: hypothetical protein KDA37_10510, partial [Planctomycetales bacterium]|nr:hypothetical protein [Planctomycetales bacterium]